MFRKSIFLLFSVLVLSTLVTTSCNLDANCDFDNRFHVIDFNVYENQITYPDDTGLPFFAQIGNEPLPYYEYALSLTPIGQTYRSDNPPSASLFAVQSAKACSPEPLKNEEPITGIRITADKDFNEEYPAGSDLTPVFDVLTLYLDSGYTTQRVQAFLNQSPFVPDQLSFILNTEPAEDQTFRFTVELDMDGVNVQEVSITSNPITISVDLN